MMGAMTLDEAIHRTAVVSTVLSEKRLKARVVSIRAIRELEERLVEAIAGEKIRGMPNLMPTGEPLYAMRINSWSRKWGASEPLPRDGREVLVLTNVGQLRVARRDGQEPWSDLREVVDEELVIEDLELFTRAVQAALEKHMALVDKRVRSIARVEDLAKRVSDAVGFKFR